MTVTDGPVSKATGSSESLESSTSHAAMSTAAEPVTSVLQRNVGEEGMWQ